MKKWLLLAAIAAACTSSGRAMAEGACTSVVRRADVVPCAVGASLVIRSEVQTGEAIAARRVAVSPLLPSNPVLALTAARRNTDVERATNWSATLSQELEIAGQRGERQRAAELEGTAQKYRVLASRRDVAAAAWTAYFDALAAGEEVRLATELSDAAIRIAEVARGMADRGLLSPVDADVADAGRIGVEQARVAAERRARSATIALAMALGVDAATSVKAEGDLEPLRGIEEDARAALDGQRDRGRDRPEVRALEAESRAHEATASALARTRVPNPTVSVFAENDGFDERVFGAGLSFPIPLPEPVGRLRDGEIAESRALATRAATEAELARRQARAGLLAALAEYDMRRRQRDLFTPDSVTHARQDIAQIAKEIQAGRLPVRDGLISQQALVGLLRSELDARLALCAASVELARAAGTPFEGRSR